MGGCTQRMQTAWLSWLGCRNNLVLTGRAISVLLGIIIVRNERSHLVGPPFPVFKAFLERRIRRLLISECG